MKPRFSIIIPAYNVEKFIVNTINSVINQKFESFEIIIVNDGSTDNTKKRIESIDDSNIIVINKKNGGLSSARNAGLEKAKGEYVWFLDGDDYIEPNSLEILDNCIKSNKNVDIICFNYYCDYGSKKEKNVDLYYNNFEKYRILSQVSACTKIYKLDFIKPYKFKEGILYEDLELIPYLLAKSNNIVYLNDCLYNYVQRNGSIMHTKVFKNNKDDRFVGLESLIIKFKSDNIYEEYKEQLSFLCVRHLIFIYFREILLYSRNIYISKAKRIVDFLNQFDNCYKSIYVSELSLEKKIYLFLFKHKMYLLMKAIIAIKG